MNKNIRKPVSILLSLLMLLSVFSCVAVTANAVTVNGINFNETWSNTSSIPVPDHDSYTGLNDKSHFGTPNQIPKAHNYSIAKNITLTGTCPIPVEKYGLFNDNYRYYEIRYIPLNSGKSVRLYLNNHSINAGGQTILRPDYSQYADFVYGFYGTGKDNEVISGAATLGANYGGTWELNNLKLTGFGAIAEINSSHPLEIYRTIQNGVPDNSIYDCYPATLNMTDVTADCVNGVNVVNGTFNMLRSTITSTGDYAVAVRGGSFNVVGANTINGTVELADNAITFAGGSKLTGNIPIKWSGRSLKGQPYVFTSGAANADLTGCTFTPADEGYVIEQTGDGEYMLLASEYNNLAGASLTGVEQTYYVINGLSPTFSYTVKNARGETLTKDTHFTQSIKKGTQTISSITAEGTYTLVLTAKNGSGYTGSLSQDFYVRLLSTTGTETINNRTFYKLANNVYAITSTADWNALADYVNAGNPCSSKTFRLTDNIDVNTSIGNGGSENKYFSGTLDGDGYTINVSFNNSGGSYVAPIGAISGATVKNFRVTGSVTGGNWASGLVGNTYNSNTIENCVVSVWLHCAYQQNSAGGILGRGCYSGGSGGARITMRGCVFNGIINLHGGAFVGVLNYVNMSDCLYPLNPSQPSYKNYYSNDNYISSNNNYYNPGNSSAVTCGEGVAVNPGTLTKDYGMLKVYPNAMEFDGVTYAKHSSTVNLTVKPPKGYVVDTVKVNDGAVAVSGSGTAYSFTMPGGAANVTATFKKNTYTVVWMNDDGEVLETDEDLTPGTVPTYDGAQPTLAPDAQYTYTFKEWSPEIVAVNGNTTYFAQYTQTPNKYTVTFVDDDTDETVLQTGEVEYGATPVYSGTEPFKEGDVQYGYTLSGWNDGSNTYAPDALPKVTGDVTYKVAYTQTVNKYNVTWINGDGSTLKTEQIEYGTTPAYTGTAPSKAATAQYTYTFSGWTVGETDYGLTDTLPTVTGDVTFTAKFDSTVNQYTVKFENYDQNLLQSDVLDYGATPAYVGDEPQKPSDAEHIYPFIGWSPEITAVTGNITYTAQFDELPNSYLVKFVNFDDAELQSGMVDYGATPVYSGETPTRPDEGDNVFLFNGWDAELIPVTAEATYTAQYLIYIRVAAVPATLTTTGNIEYYLDADNNVFVKDGDAYVETTLEATVIPELIDITGAELTLAEDTFVVDETEKTVTYTLVLDGKTLTEGTDFIVEGDVSAAKVGHYTLTVKGINAYTGEVSANWKIITKKTAQLNGIFSAVTELVKLLFVTILPAIMELVK